MYIRRGNLITTACICFDYSLEGGELVLVTEVLNVLLMQRVGAGGFLLVTMVTSDVAITVELQFEKLCKREDQGLVRHPSVWSALNKK